MLRINNISEILKKVCKDTNEGMNDEENNILQILGVPSCSHNNEK